VKVFLIQAPQWGISPPIGLAQLGAYLTQAGHEVEVFDMNIDLYRRRGESYQYAWESGFSSVWLDRTWVADFFRKHESFILSEYIRPIAAAGEAVVGFSVTSCSLVPSLLVARMIKQAVPGVRTVFGGQEFTVNRAGAAATAALEEADAIVAGDGEHTMAELLQYWKEGRDLESCKGLYCKGAGGSIFTGFRKPVVLDELPFADYRLFDLERYENLDSRMILFMASRGCVRSCLFCGYRAPWAGYRFMSGERIYAEIKHQEKVLPEVRGLYFYDLLVNGDMSALGTLCDRIVADPGVRHPWKYCNTIIRPEMTEDFCRKLKAAGCDLTQIGLESGSDHVLDLMKKEQNAGTAETVLRNLSAAGIKVMGNFMFGFPGETEEDFAETLAFLRRVHPHLAIIYPSFTFTLMEPASPIGLQKERFGVAAANRAGGDIFWESTDGTNTYPVRFERYKTFIKLAESLGLHIEYGYDCPIDAFQSYWLGRYFAYKEDHVRAIEHFENYLRHDGGNPEVRELLNQSRLARKSQMSRVASR
jgi:radical SAM superfamily enzyme YgiQ (UPF0313 family)